jgi:subtilisin family serine protease
VAVQDKTGHLISQDRVKVAILDTGIYFEHPYFRQARRMNVLHTDRCKGFPSRLNACLDKNGHGTHCTSVLLRTAPNIDLYVARVFDDYGNIPGDNEGVVEVRPCSMRSNF